jgi:hypothetical protein
MAAVVECGWVVVVVVVVMVVVDTLCKDGSVADEEGSDEARIFPGMPKGFDFRNKVERGAA